MIFFVISGFILGLPFLKALSNGSKISLKKYFLRRLTRLEPTYIIILTGLLFVNMLVPFAKEANLLPHYFASIAYCHNIIFGVASIINPVAWSLEVEIQFYILLPVIMIVLKKLTFSTRIWLYFLIVILTPYLIQFFPLSQWHLDRSILVFMPYFFGGICLADLYLNWDYHISRSFLDVIGIISTIFIFIIEFYGGGKIFLPFAIGIAFWAVLKGNRLTQFYKNSIVSITGGMCYTIYLVHYPLLYSMRLIHFQINFSSPILFYTINIIIQSIIAIGVSAFLFTIIEKPFMHHDWPRKLVSKFNFKSSKN
jgi:peptidoglycan/LPS O-acetylase OafA/YrhL